MELCFPRRLGEKCLEELDDVDAPAFRAFPLPFLVLLEGEDFLEPVVAFPAFVRIGGHRITSLSVGPGRLGGFYMRKNYIMDWTSMGTSIPIQEWLLDSRFLRSWTAGVSGCPLYKNHTVDIVYNVRRESILTPSEKRKP